MSGDGPHCPDCGTELEPGLSRAGLCPHCLLELALEVTFPATEVFDPGEAPTVGAEAREAAQTTAFCEGEIQGERYRIRSLLGRGGMGEVWRAYDLKLRQDVALKSLLTEQIADAGALEMLRQEVRVAREVISPNVCRVFDLQELDGQELVSMEYIDGTTLAEILRERSPLDLDEAREIASQFLGGLEAVHDADLVHRDIKPENIMVTRTGRVVVMDFGIAKALQEGEGGFAGTPAYMSPEQSRAGDLDARADVFSAGVVLAEMVAPGGVRSAEDRKRVLRGIHQDAPKLAETPWAGVVRQAVAPDREQRFGGAAQLARALEEVTLRAADDDARPYPGLSAFQEDDAEFFFGRELEVEALWKKLRRPHLLAVIGPSGAGKSSFLQAGLLPTLPDGWQAIVATPGDRPFYNLAEALSPELGDAPGTAELLSCADEPEPAVELLAEWRRAHARALVVIDQFEELFVQNPADVQERFANLLGRLPLEADVCVLLSMRDDFLMHCHRFESLRPVFAELSPLDPPLGASLRRALTQPALRCGYRFEDETVVEEMLAEVEGQRGALPLLAFAAEQLWEVRDRESGMLTRSAYERIGGVGGALAQHAEATLESIGEDGVPVVRELLRNLVTARGTRAARDREELLSVFAGEATGTDDRPPTTDDEAAAATVLDALIDARLLTSYEVAPADESEVAGQRVEVVHESLLSAWPRLVRWRTQDAEGAQLRDELRNQAQLWEQHGRSVDYLWTGAAYLDYLAWRERYPGGLTTAEEAFAHAMTAHAERRKRRRRAVLGIVMAGLLAVLTVVTWSRFEAIAEARRAEASKLLAFAQLRLEDSPTEALAYTTASLELADTEAARRFAARMRWVGPPAFETAGDDPGLMLPRFSPGGSRLAASGNSDKVRVWSEAGGVPVELPGHGGRLEGQIGTFWASEDLLVTGLRAETSQSVRLWKLPEGEHLRTINFGAPADPWVVRQGRLLAMVDDPDVEPDRSLERVRVWHLPEGRMEELGTVDRSSMGWAVSFDDMGNGYLYVRGDEIFHRRLPIREGETGRLVGRHADFFWWSFWKRSGKATLLYTVSRAGVQFWDLAARHAGPHRGVKLSPDAEKEGRLWLSPDGRHMVAIASEERSARVWDLDAWLEARPLGLRRGASWWMASAAVHPHGDWVAVSTHSRTRLTLWPLREGWPSVVDGYDALVRPLAFSPDGEWVATIWSSDSVRLWPVSGSGSREPITVQVFYPGYPWWDLAFDPLGRFLFIGAYADAGARSALVVPLDGSPPRTLEGPSDRASLSAVAVSPSGRQVATAFRVGPAGEHRKTLRVWDLETEELRLFDLPDGPPQPSPEVEFAVWDLAFTDESTLYTSGDGGILNWNLDTGDYEVVLGTRPGSFRIWAAFDPGSGTAFVMEPRFEGDTLGPARLLDLATGETRELPAFAGATIRASTHIPRVAFDTNGTLAAVGDQEGIIWIAPLAGGEPHLLFGHEGPVDQLAISDDGRWLVSSGEDDTLRLWPLPDLSQPPLQTLPHDELIARLRSLTNLRVVRDPESADGWKIELDPFPGWAQVPTW